MRSYTIAIRKIGSQRRVVITDLFDYYVPSRVILLGRKPGIIEVIDADEYGFDVRTHKVDNKNRIIIPRNLLEGYFSKDVDHLHLVIGSQRRFLVDEKIVAKNK